MWREVFNTLLDEELGTIEKGDVLDAGCGTGDYAVGVATLLGTKGTVLGIDPSPARIKLARAKASLKELKNLTFALGSVNRTGTPDNDFDVAVGDATMLTPILLPDAIRELKRTTRPNGTVALLTTTRGSFDEFHSIYWEALHDEDLLSFSAGIEALSQARPTVSELKELSAHEGLRRVRSETAIHRFEFEDAQAFLTGPLVTNYFLRDWLGILPEDTHQRVLAAMARIIEQSRNGISFDVSIKATILIGSK